MNYVYCCFINMLLMTLMLMIVYRLTINLYHSAYSKLEGVMTGDVLSRGRGSSCRV